ncbi:hypothetical protein [Streptomyces coelicoflavus]
MLNTWLDWLALIVLLGMVILGALAWWGRRSRVEWRVESSGISYETVLIAATPGPFVTAFATKLGERLGTTVRVKRMSWRQRRGRRAQLVVTQSFRQAVTIEVESGLSEEARLTLIDLDVERPELRTVDEHPGGVVPGQLCGDPHPVGRVTCSVTAGRFSRSVATCAATSSSRVRSATAWTFSSTATGRSTRWPSTRFAPSGVHCLAPVRGWNGASSIAVHRSS